MNVKVQMQNVKSSSSHKTKVKVTLNWFQDLASGDVEVN